MKLKESKIANKRKSTLYGCSFYVIINKRILNIYYDKGMKTMLKIRFAEEKDNQQIYNFIKQLSKYEKTSNEYHVTEENLYDTLFIKRQAEVLIAEEDGYPVGQAIFFTNFSTAFGKAGIYLEDLFVLPKYRGKGYGKELLKHLALITIERNCPRVEWLCLDWNKSAQDFYQGLGAVCHPKWLIFRLEGDNIKNLCDT